MVRRGSLLLALALGACRSAPSSSPSAAPSTTPPSSARPGESAPDGHGEAVDGLVFGAVLEGATLVTTLRNVGPIPLVVMSHVQATERQSDWVHVTLVGSDGTHRRIELSDDRDKSVAEAAVLAPGGTLVDRWDLAAWAARPRNGGKALAGATTLRASYTTRRQDFADRVVPKGARAWIGSARSSISLVGAGG